MNLSHIQELIRIRIRSGVQWAIQHKLRAGAYLLLLVVILEYLSLPNNELRTLQRGNPGRTALMELREREARSVGRPFSLHQVWVPISRVSPHLVHAVIVAEDGTFYLNIIEWGNGVFGAEAAARKYFFKSASDLTREEAARLAAVIPNPLRYQPNRPSRYVDRRSSIILERMAARGY